MLRSLLLLSAALALTGCASMQDNPPTLLTAKVPEGRGRIVVRPFYVSSGMNVIAVFLAGGMGPFKVEVYDVTAEPRYLGLMSSRGVRATPDQDAFEYNVEPGKRVLMLHMRKFGGGDFVDFAEVSVAPNGTEHVAISQYGMNDRPYLMNVKFDQLATQLCGSTPGMREREAADELKARGLPTANREAAYCAALSSSTRVKAVSGEPWGGALPREQVASLRDKWYPVWKGMVGRTPPYDVSAPNQQGL